MYESEHVGKCRREENAMGVAMACLLPSLLCFQSLLLPDLFITILRDLGYIRWGRLVAPPLPHRWIHRTRWVDANLSSFSMISAFDIIGWVVFVYAWKHFLESIKNFLHRKPNYPNIFQLKNIYIDREGTVLMIPATKQVRMYTSDESHHDTKALLKLLKWFHSSCNGKSPLDLVVPRDSTLKHISPN